MIGRIKTNRDLYLAVSQLIKQEDKNQRSLETYLLALLSLGQDYQHHKTLTPDEFLGLLSKAFYTMPLPFDDVWRKQDYDPKLEGYAAWRHRIIYQIVDLREIAENNSLNDNMRYFGIDAPRGARWYNFDPCTYLEGGLAGTFGGWEEGDDTGRVYVPGPVAVLGDAGKIESADPRDLDYSIVLLEAISWRDFCNFLIDGHSYE
jgi:hypothetical protein